MTYHLEDTICAIATAPGGAARGIVRVSGRDALQIISSLFKSDDGRPLEAIRHPAVRAGHARIDLNHFQHQPSASERHDARSRFSSNSRLPCDLFLWPTARSYTREPVGELHTIGSPPLLAALLAALCRAGARLAEPGEFTLRAFLAGRLDLTQAEAVLGVVDAHGDDELRSALTQLAGGLARPLRQLRDELLQLLAEVEAGLDFVDEDIEFVSAAEVRERVESALEVLAEVAAQMESRHTTGQTTRVTLVGEPNVGKSSLFNALVARRGAAHRSRRRLPALVSPQRGTTRDYLTANIDLDGIVCELVDTAGWEDRSAADRQTTAIDAAAQSLTAEQRDRATIRACCIEAAQIATAGNPPTTACDMIVLTKSDIPLEPPRIAGRWPADIPVIVTSSRTGEGLDDLCVAIRSVLTEQRAAQHGQVVAATAHRCRESIRLAEAALRRATEIASTRGGDELLAAELRNALSELGKVVGAIYTDDLLDRIFSSFCIGK